MAFRFSFHPAPGRKNVHLSFPAALWRPFPRRTLIFLFLPSLLLASNNALAWYRVGTGSDDSLPCNAYYSSSLAFKPSTDSIEFCDGTTWNSLLGANGAITLGTSAGATNPQRNGDPTTGLFSAATSTVSVATGGVEALRVDAHQRIGIGTAAPAAPLDVYGGIDITEQNAISFPNNDATSIAIGPSALSSQNATNSSNIAVGSGALQNASSGTNNIAVGYQALIGVTTGLHNIALGHFAGRFVNGYGNIAIGESVLYGGSAASSGDIGIGDNAMYGNTGSNNIAVGGGAFQAGYVTTTGSNNVLLGDSTGNALLTGSSNILIGHAVNTPTGADASNTLNIGNVIYGTGMYGAGLIGIGTAAPAEPFEIYSSGSGVLLQLAGSSGTCNHTPGSSSETVSCSSDMRMKTSTHDAASALPWLSSIRVRDFTWKNTGQQRTGVIAQELQKTHPEMVTYDKKKDEWTVEQPNPWVLVKLLQEQQAEIDDLKKQLTAKH